MKTSHDLGSFFDHFFNFVEKTLQSSSTEPVVKITDVSRCENFVLATHELVGAELRQPVLIAFTSKLVVFR